MDSAKLRAVGRWSILLAAALGTGGCFIEADDDDRVHHDHDWNDDDKTPPVSDQPMLVSIDTDAIVNSEPGEGVGVFVQYAADGKWRVWTSCDTNTSKVVCSFDLYASVDTSSDLLEVAGEDLEGPDETRIADEGVAYMHAETASDIDALTFTTTPGAIVRLETYLDDVSQPRFVYWFGNGVLHEGAPTNPIDFEPTSP